MKSYGTLHFETNAHLERLAQAARDGQYPGWIRMLSTESGFVVNGLLRDLSRFFLPPVCVLCGDAVRSRSIALDLCSACAHDLPGNSPACSVCAVPITASAHELLCGQCLRKRPRFDRAFCAFRYDFPLDHLIRDFKFHGRLAYGRVLGELLSIALQRSRSEPWPELLLPVPLAEQRFRERGFNQAIELGRILERNLRVPLRADLLERIRSTREQTGLDAKTRRKNLRGAFRAREPLPARHIAILDDVITTGSTANELARVLRRAGARRIEVWAVARTPR